MFSSTSTVYGEPESSLREDMPTAPVHLRLTKLAVEQMLQALRRSGPWRQPACSTSTRWGHPSGRIGEDLGPQQPVSLHDAGGGGTSEAPRVFGDDYPTHDGTSIATTSIMDLAEHMT